MSWPAVRFERAIPLRNRDYYDYLVHQIRSAQRRVWASIFIVNPLRGSDPNLDVRQLFSELVLASRHAVDVRILVGDSHQTIGIRESNMVARKLLQLRGLLARCHRAPERSSTHEKYVIVDEDLCILGSHNWTHRAFNESQEDSLAVRSADLVLRLETSFLRAWQASDPTKPGVPRQAQAGKEPGHA
jgi:phosphatidylserine/phosphatidylglycerophosphate/cardiolipin synthase-like enzyme